MSDDTHVSDVARRAAERLAANIGPQLPDQVEQALADDPLERPPQRIFDPISLGALVVSIASLGWTIYHDLKKDSATAGLSQAGQAERLFTRLQEDGTEGARLPPEITPEHKNLITQVVAEEIVGSGI